MDNLPPMEEGAILATIAISFIAGIIIGVVVTAIVGVRKFAEKAENKKLIDEANDLMKGFKD